MLCEKCQQNEVVIKITKIVNGVHEEYNVCSQCAAEISPHHAKILKNTQKQLSVENLLQELIQKHEATGAAARPASADSGLMCTSCGLDYTVYRKTLMLGCPECYNEFGEKLERDIRKIHGATEHLSEEKKTDEGLRKAQSQLRTLEAELNEAIDKEDFDQAALLRDKIAELRNNISKG